MRVRRIRIARGGRDLQHAHLRVADRVSVVIHIHALHIGFALFEIEMLDVILLAAVQINSFLVNGGQSAGEIHFTNENLGAGNLELPENEMHTTAYWITLERPLLESLPFTVSERQSGMFGLLHALESVATLLLMCDGRDLGTAIGERPPDATAMEAFSSARMEEIVGVNAKEFFEPNLYLFDAYPGGIGFSEPLFRAHELLVHKTRELIRACECDQGCPSCVGPAGDLAPRTKEAALAILDRLCA